MVSLPGYNPRGWLGFKYQVADHRSDRKAHQYCCQKSRHVCSALSSSKNCLGLESIVFQLWSIIDLRLTWFHKNGLFSGSFHPSPTPFEWHIEYIQQNPKFLFSLIPVVCLKESKRLIHKSTPQLILPGSVECERKITQLHTWPLLRTSTVCFPTSSSLSSSPLPPSRSLSHSWAFFIIFRRTLFWLVSWGKSGPLRW